MHNHTDIEWLRTRLAFISALRAELADIKRLLAARRAYEAKYNPRWREQPRAPKGTSDGGEWVDGGGGGTPKAGGARPPPRPPPRPGPGHNRPPEAAPAPMRPYLDWRNMSDREYFASIGVLTRQRQHEDRIAALQDAIRAFDPNFRFGPIVTPRRPGVYEEYLREQLHILRIQAHGPLGMERLQWTQFRQEVTGALRRSRYPSAASYLRGSAVSGVSFRRGVLDPSGPRDFDAAIVSPTLFAAARARGFGIRGRATRTVPLRFDQLAQLGAPGLPQNVNGRGVSYVIFSSPGAMRLRPGPAVPLAPRRE